MALLKLLLLELMAIGIIHQKTLLDNIRGIVVLMHFYPLTFSMRLVIHLLKKLILQVDNLLVRMRLPLVNNEPEQTFVVF